MFDDGINISCMAWHGMVMSMFFLSNGSGFCARRVCASMERVFCVKYHGTYSAVCCGR